MTETSKNTRILEMHTLLTRGECLRKRELAQNSVLQRRVSSGILRICEIFICAPESIVC